MSPKKPIQQVRSRDELISLEQGSIVNVMDIGPMRYQSMPNRDKMVFIGRTGKKTKSISTITIDANSINIDKDGSLSFKKPYEVDKVFDHMLSNKQMYNDLSYMLRGDGI